MILLTPPQINVIVDDLTGTPHDLGDTIQELTGLPLDQIDLTSLEEIDARVFQCEACGWWCEVGEMGDSEDVCMDCEDCGCVLEDE
jgi:hypothetical protein